jgi:hypothetical protein
MRVAGNDSANPNGINCGAEDLCQFGWHVCTSDADVAAKSPSGCDGALDRFTGVLWATGQSGDNTTCGPGDSDTFGCGDLGSVAMGCMVLTVDMENLCEIGAPWSCSNRPSEHGSVVKSDATRGGVLCCRD